MYSVLVSVSLGGEGFSEAGFAAVSNSFVHLSPVSVLPELVSKLFR